MYHLAVLQGLKSQGILGTSQPLGSEELTALEELLMEEVYRVVLVPKGEYCRWIARTRALLTG